ncbi:hypothetical protein Bca4012_042065 [Brassica carinata]
MAARRGRQASICVAAMTDGDQRNSRTGWAGSRFHRPMRENDLELYVTTPDNETKKRKRSPRLNKHPHDNHSANCKCLGVILFTFGTLLVFQANSKTSAVRDSRIEAVCETQDILNYRQTFQNPRQLRPAPPTTVKSPPHLFSGEVDLARPLIPWSTDTLPMFFLGEIYSSSTVVLMAYRKSRLEKGKWIPEPAREPRRPPIRLPQVNTAALIEEHKFTLIGRVTNPKIQKTRALVDFFLQHWKVAGTITGRDLGPNLFQFKFETEQDLQSILSKAPFHFKRWMIILQRWEPIVSDYFPALIPFWISIHGLPLHYWTDVALETIGNELGPVEKYDVERGRIRILINGLKPLEMKLDVSSPSAEIKQVELEYEGLEKHCFTCHSLSHEKDDCPSQRALVNHRDPAPHMGISQSRKLERIDAERRKAEERRRVRSDSSQWQRPSTREIDWQNDKSFRYNYGARRDPNYRVDNSRRDETAPGSRRPVRERLSLSKDDDLTRSKESHSRRQSKAPTSEWRPVASGSKLGSVQNNALSLVSHTPSPRPQREGGSSIAVGSPASRLGSGGGSAPSQERRSALNRLSLPNERIPILQDGAANPDSGRLKERDTQAGVEAVPSPRSGNLPSDPRNLGTTTAPNMMLLKTALLLEHSVKTEFMSPKTGPLCLSMKKKA